VEHIVRLHLGPYDFFSPKVTKLVN